MRIFFLFILILFSIYSCATYDEKHFYQRNDGTWITKKQWERATNRAWKKAIKEIPKEELNILFDSKIIIDTTSNPK